MSKNDRLKNISNAGKVDDRSAVALRENLFRRKAQARARATHDMASDARIRHVMPINRDVSDNKPDKNEPEMKG